MVLGSTVCEFCGRRLDTMMVPYMRMEVPIPCDCMGAVAQREREDREEWERNRRECMEAAIRRAGIPSRFTAYDSYGRGNGVYLYGAQGRGKTERACGALRGYIDSGIVEIDHNRFWATKTARFVAVPDWLLIMKRTYDTRGSSEADVMDAYGNVGMLCLDDLGKGQMTPWAIERIYTLLNRRYNECRPTVITSQYDGDGLVRVLSAKSDEETARAIWSRIEGMCKVGEIVGEDWRKKS